MIIVGIKTNGNSLIKKEDIPAEIQLKQCITWRQLQKYDYKLLENIKQDDFDNVKTLTGGNLYSIGACDTSIKQISLYIKSLSEILDEKSAIQEEKERSIRAIQKKTAENVELNKQLDSFSNTNEELRNKIKTLKLESDKNKATIEELERKNKALQDKLIAESSLRQKTEEDLATFKNSLGEALEENQDKLLEQENKLTNTYTTEIEKIKVVLQEKEDIIIENNKKIEELEKINEELGKAGTLPDIPFTYSGKSLVVGFYGQGSYGVSGILHTVAMILARQRRVLVIDLDFKIGNLNSYFEVENKSINNILSGGSIIKEHIIRSFKSESCLDYIGGVLTDSWTPYKIMNLPWQALLDGEYDYILCDLGSINCYSIQNKVREMIIKNSYKSFFIYKYENSLPSDEKIINIKNMSSDIYGIPFISSVIVDNIKLEQNPIIQQKIKELVVNQIVT